MPQDLQALFERALDDEPVPPPGDPVRQAMAGGRRLRRRRGLLVGCSAAAAVAAAVVAVNVALLPAEPPRVPPAAAGPACASPVRDNVTDVAVFLRDDVSLEQIGALRDALWTDPGVRDLQFENRQQAYQRFKRLWADNPDFVASVSAESLPQSFRVELADPSGYRRFADRFQPWAGVQDIVGQACPGAPK